MTGNGNAAPDPSRPQERSFWSEILEQVERPVEVRVVAGDAAHMLERLASLQPLIRVTRGDLRSPDGMATVGLAPVGEDPVLWHLGTPRGGEWVTLVACIVECGRHEHPMPPTLAGALDEVVEPLEMDLFTSPASLRCHETALLLCRASLRRPQVSVRLIPVHEHRDLFGPARVTQVPHLVINGRLDWEGRLSPDLLADLIRISR